MPDIGIAIAFAPNSPALYLQGFDFALFATEAGGCALLPLAYSTEKRLRACTGESALVDTPVNTDAGQ